jgi:hypothetical protein
MRLIFSKGQWIQVLLPIGHDPCWSKGDTYYYARMWATSVEKGFSTKRAEVIAEAAVAKRMYPEIIYDRSLESDIQSLFD